MKLRSLQGPSRTISGVHDLSGCKVKTGPTPCTPLVPADPVLVLRKERLCVRLRGGLFFFGGATYAAEQTKDGARGLSVKQG
jgi:hypothetical protein